MNSYETDIEELSQLVGFLQQDRLDILSGQRNFTSSDLIAMLNNTSTALTRDLNELSSPSSVSESAQPVQETQTSYQSRPVYQAPTTQFQSQPTQFQSRPTQFQSRPTQFQSRPTQFQSQASYRPYQQSISQGIPREFSNYDQTTLTNICDAFINNPNINPITSRQITPGGRIHQNLTRLCQFLGYQQQQLPQSSPQIRQSVQQRQSSPQGTMFQPYIPQSTVTQSQQQASPRLSSPQQTPTRIQSQQFVSTTLTPPIVSSQLQPLSAAQFQPLSAGSSPRFTTLRTPTTIIGTTPQAATLVTPTIPTAQPQIELEPETRTELIEAIPQQLPIRAASPVLLSLPQQQISQQLPTTPLSSQELIIGQPVSELQEGVIVIPDTYYTKYGLTKGFDPFDFESEGNYDVYNKFSQEGLTGAPLFTRVASFLINYSKMSEADKQAVDQLLETDPQRVIREYATGANCQQLLGYWYLHYDPDAATEENIDSLLQQCYENNNEIWQGLYDSYILQQQQ